MAGELLGLKFAQETCSAKLVHESPRPQGLFRFVMSKTAHLDLVQHCFYGAHKPLGLKGNAKLLALLARPVSPGSHAGTLLHIAWPHLYPYWHPLQHARLDSRNLCRPCSDVMRVHLQTQYQCQELLAMPNPLAHSTRLVSAGSHKCALLCTLLSHHFLDRQPLRHLLTPSH